jgi:hypothetical protein
MLKMLPPPVHMSPSEVLFGTVAVKLMALPGVMYSMNPCPQPLVDPA